MICTQQDVIDAALELSPQFNPMIALVEVLTDKFCLDRRAARVLVKDAIRDRRIQIEWIQTPEITGKWRSTGPARKERPTPIGA